MRTLLFTLLVLAFPVIAFANPDYQYGTPIQHENLTLVPIYHPKGTPEFTEKYLTFAEASQEGLIKVSELNGNTDAAQVASVHVTSKADKPIFLMAGEVILGGKQDRIISKNTIISARKKQLEVGVFCVEHGRWDGQKADFKASGKVAHANLRTTAQFDDDQSKVWEEVAKQNKKSNVAPSTGTYRATLNNKEQTAAVKRYVKVLLPRLAADGRAIGVVVAIDGKMRSLDAFANPALFGKVRKQLLNAYALTAVSSGTKSKDQLRRSEIDGLNARVAKSQKAKKKVAESGDAANDYYDAPSGKRAVTRSKSGAKIHEFMSLD